MYVYVEDELASIDGDEVWAHKCVCVYICMWGTSSPQSMVARYVPMYVYVCICVCGVYTDTYRERKEGHTYMYVHTPIGHVRTHL